MPKEHQSVYTNTTQNRLLDKIVNRDKKRTLHNNDKRMNLPRRYNNYKIFARLPPKIRDKTQITKIRNETEDITTD